MPRRIEAKRLSVQPKQTDLGALVDSVVESVDEVKADHDLRVTIEGEALAWIDPDRIHQALGNLLSNAAKYGRPGTKSG